ncbi:class IV adenylate cyclase [Candidatus Falkowbacteria bacterium]|nr:class IV adenylate cyclase [Candidatus Falkowbacteria bacterium]
MKNFEVKARINDIARYETICKQIGAQHVSKMRQIDTYFHVPLGRLKLREADKKEGELIYYRRQEKTNKRWSSYYIAPITDPPTFKELLTKAYGVKIVVDKKRLLYQYKNARIHLDLVKNLGSFIEIEVVVKKSMVQARVLMKLLLLNLHLPEKNFIKESYSDLLNK